MSLYDSGSAEPDRSRDPFSDDTAAYLLGALPPGESERYESHLASCPSCAARLAELRPAVGLLAHATEDDVLAAGEPVEPYPSLLPALLARASAQRRRRRWALGALGSVAAAAVALTITLAAGRGSPPAQGRDMVALGTGSTLHATVALTGTAWGTRIELDCSYATGSGYPAAPGTYELEVTGPNGGRQLLGSWTVQATGHTHFTSGTALRPGQIAAVRIELPDGTPVLHLTW